MKSRLILFCFISVSILAFHQNCTPLKFNENSSEQSSFSAPVLDPIRIVNKFSIEKNYPVSLLEEVNFDNNGKPDFILGYASVYSSDSGQYGSELCLDAMENQFSNCFPLYSNGPPACETYGNEEYCSETFIDKENLNSVGRGDFNQDGKEDFVLFADKKAWLLQNSGMLEGKPKFSKTVFYTGARELNGTVTDFDSNGSPDIVYFESYEKTGKPVTSDLKVIFNGEFTSAPVTYDLPNEAKFEPTLTVSSPHTQISWEVAGVDLDGDNKKEIFVKTQYAEEDYILKYSSRQDVQLKLLDKHLEIYTDAKTQFLDINKDGNIDIYMPLRSGQMTSVFLGKGNLDFEAWDMSQSWEMTTEFAAWLDVDSNGTLDLFSIGSEGQNLLAKVSWRASQGMLNVEHFSDPEMMAKMSGEVYRSIRSPTAVIDSDGNGLYEFVMATNKGITVLEALR